MTRGELNFNPGNIVISNIPWMGKIPVDKNTDGTFEQFIAMKYGIRALMKNLMNYIREGFDTIEKIIRKWSETDQEAYIANVAAWTGFDKDAKLTADEPTVKAIARAIIRQENGANTLVAQADIDNAWKLIMEG